MPRKPNYKFERLQRDRAKAEKKEARAKAKAEKADAKKVEAGGAEIVESPPSEISE